ncbi:MAG TPA: hypothetical protein PLM08_20170, partial [Polyangiaceae bacterium]|nr:hypothetical protein [Polyangiaceae bacterium]
MHEVRAMASACGPVCVYSSERGLTPFGCGRGKTEGTASSGTQAASHGVCTTASRVGTGSHGNTTGIRAVPRGAAVVSTLTVRAAVSPVPALARVTVTPASSSA